MGLLSKAAVKTAVPGLPVKEVKDIEQKLENHFRLNSSIGGVVLEIPPGFAEKEGENFEAMINQVIALLGSALPLPSGRVLAIFPDTVDRELVADQLEKSIHTKALAVFSAEAPARVLECIGPYL